MTSDDLRLDFICLFRVDIKVAYHRVFVYRICRRIMFVEILGVVNDDKLHLLQFIFSIGVTCNRTIILTL